MYSVIPQIRPSLRKNTKFRIDYCIDYQRNVLREIDISLKSRKTPRNIGQTRRLLSVRSNKVQIEKAMIKLMRYREYLFNGK